MNTERRGRGAWKKMKRLWLIIPIGASFFCNHSIRTTSIACSYTRVRKVCDNLYTITDCFIIILKSFLLKFDVSQHNKQRTRWRKNCCSLFVHLVVRVLDCYVSCIKVRFYTTLFLKALPFYHLILLRYVINSKILFLLFSKQQLLILSLPFKRTSQLIFVTSS